MPLKLLIIFRKIEERKEAIQGKIAKGEG